MGPTRVLACVCLGASGLCKLQLRCCSTHARLLLCTLVPTNPVVLLHKQAPLQYKRCSAQPPRGAATSSLLHWLLRHFPVSCIPGPAAGGVVLCCTGVPPQPAGNSCHVVCQGSQAQRLNRHQAGRHAERHARIAVGMNSFLGVVWMVGEAQVCCCQRLRSVNKPTGGRWAKREALFAGLVRPCGVYGLGCRTAGGWGAVWASLPLPPWQCPQGCLVTLGARVCLVQGLSGLLPCPRVCQDSSMVVSAAGGDTVLCPVRDAAGGWVVVGRAGVWRLVQHLPLWCMHGVGPVLVAAPSGRWPHHWCHQYAR